MPLQPVEAPVQFVALVTAQIPVGEAAIQGIGGANLAAADPQVETDLTGNARQEIAAADIREITDSDFRHGQPTAFGDYPQVGALR